MLLLIVFTNIMQALLKNKSELSCFLQVIGFQLIIFLTILYFFDNQVDS